MGLQYDREQKALRLLYPKWEEMDVDEQRGKHDMLMWTIQAAVDARVVEWSRE